MINFSVILVFYMLVDPPHPTPHPKKKLNIHTEECLLTFSILYYYSNFVHVP